MYDYHTDRKIFSTRYTMTQTLLHFSNKIQPSPLKKTKKIPPFQILEPLLNPPRFSVQEPHKHIFVMTKKEYIFAIAHFSCPQNQKKKVKKSTKKEKLPKNKQKIPSLGKAEKKILSLTKVQKKLMKKILLTYL